MEKTRLGKPPKTRAIPDLPAWVTLPGGSAVLGSREEGAPPPREVEMSPFWMSRTEITTAQFAQFLNDTGASFDSPQFYFTRGRHYPRAPQDAAAFVPYDLAEAYARWAGRWLKADVSLPTEEEWEYAARGGIFAAPFPWGWADPTNRAAFNLEGARPVGLYPPNPFKLYDMAGNLAEWCRAEPGAARAPVRGGSWSERSDVYLRVWKRVELPREYRDADVGFRVIARPLKPAAD